MSKTLIHALLACAVGVALGLSVDCAQAANVPGLSSAEEVCEMAGTNGAVCQMHYAQPESKALEYAKGALLWCKNLKDQPTHPVSIYISQNSNGACLMKRMLVVLLLLAAPAWAEQEVNGWHRDTPLRQQWRADHAACVAANTTKGKPPETQTPLGLSMGLSPVPPSLSTKLMEGPQGGVTILRGQAGGTVTDWSKVTACMNAKGWFR